MNPAPMMLRAVLENPADDTARLVYADALEEHARHYRDMEHAGVIRRMVAARAAGNRVHRMQVGDRLQWSHYRDYGNYWYDEVVDLCAAGHLADTQVPGAVHYAPFPLAPESRQCVWRGGFVEEIALTMAEFLASDVVLQDLFGHHPVTRVTLIDRLPDFCNLLPNAEVSPTGAGWTRNWQVLDVGAGTMFGTSDEELLVAYTELVPRRLFRFLFEPPFPEDDNQTEAEFPTERAAVLALGHACVRYGRALADLPDLPYPSEDVPLTL